jgi:hypothetical protein
MRVVELKSFPAMQINRIYSFIEGAKKVLDNLDNSVGNDPMHIDYEYRMDECYIYLLVGEWVGPGEAKFPSISDNVERD